jgi:hypothetical protein
MRFTLVPYAESHKLVMPGLVPGIHVLRAAGKVVDGRDKPGHDDGEAVVRKLRRGRMQQPLRKRGEAKATTPRAGERTLLR